MPIVIDHLGKKFAVDVEDYLVVHDGCDGYGPEWIDYWLKVVNPTLPDNQKLAAQLDSSGELTKEHYRVITVLREYYQKNNDIPHVRTLVNEYNKELQNNEKISIPKVYELFPAGPDKGAGVLAGVPSASNTWNAGRKK